MAATEEAYNNEVAENNTLKATVAELQLEIINLKAQLCAE